MQRIGLISTMVGVLFSPQAVHAQGSFEGTIAYEVTVPNRATVQMTHYVKDSQVRMDFQLAGQTLSMLTDTEGSKQIVLMHGQKKWLDAKAMQQRMGVSVPGRMSAEDAARAVADLQIQPTGEKEMVAGHECEHYRMISDGTEIDVCAAKGMGWYLATMAATALSNLGSLGVGPQGLPGMTSAQLAQWQQMFADGFLPLKATMTGASTVHMVVTSIDRRAVEATLFERPTDYSEMRIGG